MALMAASWRVAVRSAQWCPRRACSRASRRAEAATYTAGMDRFLSIDAFVRVAESQSFAEAARQMRVSKSVVTARMQQLEDLRRRAAVSPQHAQRAPVGARPGLPARLRRAGRRAPTKSSTRCARSPRRRPAGCACMRCPASCSATWRSVLQEFQARYPQIVLDMIVNDAAIDPVKEGFDCALQIFPPRSEELISKKLFPVRRVFCASPDYLQAPWHAARAARPARPPHRLVLGLPDARAAGVPWHRARSVSLELKPVLLTNSVHLLREYALEHAGIVCLPTLVASDAVLAGRAAGRAARAPAELVLALGVLPADRAQLAQAQALPRDARAQLRAACRRGTRR